MCSLWPPATDPLTRGKCVGNVLFAGGLAPWSSTSEVSPPKKRALFVVRAWGLDETLGRRDCVPGEGVAHQGGETCTPPNPRPRKELRCQVCLLSEHWTTVGELGLPPHPGVPGPVRCVVLEEECQGPRAHHPPRPSCARVFPLLGKHPLQDHHVSQVGRGELDPGRHGHCPRWAVSRLRRQPLELENTVLFKAYFLAPGPAGLLGYWGRLVRGRDTSWASEGGWGSTQSAGISPLGVSRGAQTCPLQGTPGRNPAVAMPVLFHCWVGPRRGELGAPVT